MKTLTWLLKRKILVLGLMAFFVTSNAQSNKNYIEEYKTIATDLSGQFGIPYSVIMAVAMVESSSGHGKAAKNLNNHFGIVGKSDVKPVVAYKTRYKAYESAQESFVDFCNVLARKSFYNTLRNTKDPKQWVKAISMAGYSSQPKVWETRILKIIASHKF